jgi:Na+:H+ antiporter, NhaA family
MPLHAEHDDLTAPWARSDRLVPRVLAHPVQRFLDTEAAGGVVLLVAAVVALAWASSPWSASYEQLWSTELTVGTAGVHLTESLRHWVNDLAMGLFFFVAGLEIKRELVHGDLRKARTAMLPILCAVGGMVVPALLFLAFNAGGPGVRGWGIPMATDIAFSVGVLALVGRRTPASLKVFLLTLAIVDDIGAIVVIALFYSSGVSLAWLAGAAGIVVAIAVLKRIGVRSLVPYVVLAAALWLVTFESGVHATIAGVVLGLLTPARPLQRPAAVAEVAADRLRDRHLTDDTDEERDETSMLQVSSLTAQAVSPVGRLQHHLHPYSSFVVLPLFALANAGVDLTPDSGSGMPTSPVALGIIIGLVVGKPLGILLAALVATKLLKGSLPAHAGWVELAGVGLLAGIGFTVSLFVTGLAFTGTLEVEAKLAILVASVLAGGCGAALLALRSTSHPLVDAGESDDGQ